MSSAISTDATEILSLHTRKALFSDIRMQRDVMMRQVLGITLFVAALLCSLVLMEGVVLGSVLMMSMSAAAIVLCAILVLRGVRLCWSAYRQMNNNRKLLAHNALLLMQDLLSRDSEASVKAIVAYMDTYFFAFSAADGHPSRIVLHSLHELIRSQVTNEEQCSRMQEAVQEILKRVDVTWNRRLSNNAAVLEEYRQSRQSVASN